MDTIRYTLGDDLSEDFNAHISGCSLLSEVERAELIFHVEIMRHIQELNHLFQVFRFNLLTLRDSFVLTSSDTLTRKRLTKFEVNQSGEIRDATKQIEIEISDGIAINALTISLASSGVALMESIKVFIEHDFSEYFKAPKGLSKTWLDEVYNKNFAYRLLYELRNFSQHGHLPISVDGSKFALDFIQLLSTPHYKHKKERREQIEAIAAEIFNCSERPRIAFTPTIADYNLCITKTYVDFLRKTKSAWRDSAKRVKAIVQRYPSNIFKPNNSSFELFVFSLYDDDMHTIDFGSAADNMVSDYLEKGKQILLAEQAIYREFSKSYKRVKTSNPCHNDKK